MPVEQPEAPSKTSPRPEFKISRTKQLFFALAIFVVFLVGLEVLLRIVGYPEGLRNDPDLATEADNFLGYEYTPGWTGYRQGALLSINSAGRRGKDVPETKPEGVFRILGIGDSFTFGTAVEDQDVYLEQLENMLNGRGRRRYDTINAGRENSNTFQQLRYLQEADLFKLDPDVVVLGFTTYNDAHVSVHRYGLAVRHRLRDRDNIFDITESRNVRTLATRSRILHALRSGIRWMKMNDMDRITYRMILDHYEDTTETWELCRSSLLGLYEECRRREVPLIVVLFPIFPTDLNLTFNDYPARSHKLHRKLAAVFEGKPGVSVVDVVDDLAGSGMAGKDLRVKIDGHPNRAYLEIVAKRLSGEIERIAENGPDYNGVD